MNATGLGEAITRLSWLSPCVDSLVALTRCPAVDAWARVRLDPGAVLLVLRERRPLVPSPAFPAFQALFMIQPSLRGRDAFWTAADPAS